MTDLWLQSLPKLSPYAVSQLSLLTFLSGFFLAFAFKVPIVLVAPILTAVPVTRICPGVLRADVAVAKQALACLVAVLFALILTWATRLAISRSWASGGSGLDWGTVTDCGALAGRDCTGVLGSWAGAQNCAVLADTHGTCKAYCERHGRRCVRAMDDVGTGECRLQAGGHARQRQDDHGCLQDWRTQLCACTGPEAEASRPPLGAPGGASRGASHGTGALRRRLSVEGALLPRGWLLRAPQHAGPRPDGGPHSAAVPAALREDAGLRALLLVAGRGLPPPGVPRLVAPHRPWQGHACGGAGGLQGRGDAPRGEGRRPAVR
eukprot:CAMPEP_0176305380 /NCGR_PEP_ID=MMETSP0121_2-20121125/62930_1 /TAXON_ID=160619 /ORGANISM="Kryptoperidinium foliaceum, Strain CCMP 1326" /LENGTH=320 /DNA_ID=CAMNT_0017647043 /DNA_START=26 /DNA_END=985 /DNA_ORIENTATION=+